jgi:hypothetical protein
MMAPNLTCSSNGWGSPAIDRAITVTKLIALDVDHTLEISNGPIPLSALAELRKMKHIVGIAGNWGLFTQVVEKWYDLVSFIGPYDGRKPAMLKSLKRYIPAAHYIMVGNNEQGKSEDDIAARLAGYEFVKEDQFEKWLIRERERHAQTR